jgi:broad specificity phosphatase PhoE
MRRTYPRRGYRGRMSDLHCPARVFVARHGEASYDDGERLTAAGAQQARELGERLRGARVAQVHASSMPRAAETARIAAALLGVDVALHDELGEVGVESELEVVDRIEVALAAIADLYRGEAVLVVGHQAVLGLALARLLPGAPTLGLDPGEVVALERDADGWVLRSARLDTSARKN